MANIISELYTFIVNTLSSFDGMWGSLYLFPIIVIVGAFFIVKSAF